MAHEALAYRADQLVSTPEPFQAAAHQAGALTVLQTFDNSSNRVNSIQCTYCASAFRRFKDSFLCARFSMFSIISGNPADRQM